MLVENVNGERRASSMMKNSEFYIEVAKFVQAYTTIVNNPNEFLTEIHEPTIDESSDRLTWQQFVNIVQKCDLGFKEIPTPTELVVYYNYALEIGTIDPKEQRLASVDDVADAQKHYYNFVDEAKDRAEAEYLRQKRITEMRERESAIVDNQLSSIKAKNYICFTFMMIACAIGGLGLVSLLFENGVANAIGSIIPVWKKQYIGGIILILVAVLVFWIFDKLYIKTKSNFLKLKQASSTIFDRTDETYAIEQILKRKLSEVTKNYKIVQAELKDKTKKFDVKHNIEVLKTSNKYYKKLCEVEQEFSVTMGAEQKEGFGIGDEEQEFAPIKLSKEQEENLRTVNKEAIKLEGQFDVDAYNEKFEKSTKKEDEKEQEAPESAEQKDAAAQEENEELMESIDFIRNVLGFAADEQEQEEQKELEEIEKSK